MRTIQEVGLEILENNPSSMYILCGPEIGIKEKYIEQLASFYGDKVEVDKVSDILNIMRTKHILPLSPKLYVVRYDDDFISKLNDNTENEIKNTKIIGTVVCIYENSKHINKISKYLPNYSVSIDIVDPKFVKVYIKSEFTNISSNLVDLVVNISANYSQARNICRAIDSIPKDYFDGLSDYDISKLFGYSYTSNESLIKEAIASRNFKFFVDMLDAFEGDINNLFYTILSTMIDLEKCKCSSVYDSPLQKYSKLWKLEDIYNMFMHSYEQLKIVRSNSISDVNNLLIFLAGLLPYQTIPSLEMI